MLDFGAQGDGGSTRPRASERVEGDARRDESYRVTKTRKCEQSIPPEALEPANGSWRQNGASLGTKANQSSQHITGTQAPKDPKGTGSQDATPEEDGAPNSGPEALDEGAARSRGCGQVAELAAEAEVADQHDGTQVCVLQRFTPINALWSGCWDERLSGLRPVQQESSRNARHTIMCNSCATSECRVTSPCTSG